MSASPSGASRPAFRSQGLSDAPDATLVAIAAPGDRIATADPGDIGRLVVASGRPVLVVPC